MKNLNELASSFLTTNKAKSLPSQKPINSFQSLFQVNAEDENDLLELKTIVPEIEQEDFSTLRQMTLEIKSIQKQGIVLLGERIFSVKQLLSKYPESNRCFTKWLSYAFSSVKSAYNALGFYQLYSQLPSEALKAKLKQMPAKTTYALASRKGDIEAKIAIINNYQGETHEEFFEKIRQEFPLDEQDKRKKEDFHFYVKKCKFLIRKMKKTSSKEKIQELEQLIDEINQLIIR